MSELNELGQQRTAWRHRLIEAVLERKFDDEVLVTMLIAGFEQAHEDGIADAADICRDVAEAAPNAARIASTLEKSLRQLIRMNKKKIDVAA